jgi:rubrerythrin
MNNYGEEGAKPLLDDLLVEAMKSEMKAKEFYLNASTKAQSQAGKKLFRELGEFEQNHFERLKKIVESRNKGQSFKNLGSRQMIPMVRSEVQGEFEGNKDEIVEMIHLAVESEKNAYARYKEIAAMFKDAEGKNIFNELAEEERKHQRILEDEFYHISNNGTIIWE